MKLIPVYLTILLWAVIILPMSASADSHIEIRPESYAGAERFSLFYDNAEWFTKEDYRDNYVEDYDSSNCKCRGINMYGKVQVVISFPDIKVQVVSSFEDLKVQKVTSFPDSCGKWQFVESFPDFKIQFVESFPDLKIRFVDSFP